MGWCLWSYWVACLVFNSLFSHAHVYANSFDTSSMQLSCHDDERLALLQFKQSFVIDRSASAYEGAYSKVLSWKSEGESSNCCSWDGVECDEKTGYVIGLILNSSCLYGSINSNSSLFRLVHLQKLNLADNHFNYSLIPSTIGKFSGLTYLNLSNSRFYGQIPSEISHLSKLTFLDLATNFDVNDNSKQYWLLELKNPSLRSLIQNLTSLEWLRFTSVYIPSTVPHLLANFTSLKWIFLQNCGLFGKFPVNVFHLPNLQVLKLGWNKNLSGFLPEFHQPSPLQELILSETSFSGSIPSSIEKLESLKSLYLWRCSFSRPLPSSLGKLTQLTYLGLGENHFGGTIPSCLGNLSQLRVLMLGDNNFSGSIPSSFQKLTQLTDLGLVKNHLHGTIPSWLGNLSKLSFLGLGDNHFIGSIPSSFQRLTQLTHLALGKNHLGGIIPSWLGNLSRLSVLGLGSNNLGGSIPSSMQKLTKLTEFYLGSNQISGPIPSWLGTLTQLKTLNFRENNINGYIPSSFQNLSQVSFLNLGDNQITGPIPSWIGNLTQLTEIYLNGNELHSSIPYSLSQLKNLRYLLLHGNNLSSSVEFVNFFTMKSLVYLDLSWNRLSLLFEEGNINETTLKFIGIGFGDCNLSQFPNFLQYQNKLEYLDLSYNKIQGQIPKWMWNTSVESLMFLHLRGNLLVDFRQPSPMLFLPWINLLELDLSFNMLRGQLPIPQKPIKFYRASNNWLTGEISSMICNFSSLLIVDFSSNNFNGTVPQCLGKLKLLLVLNLRNNSFHGSIPQVCARETSLRMMDLSHNKFDGQLPRSLVACKMLEYLDLENNQLSGGFPTWLGTLPELELLSLRHNEFSGVIQKPKQDFLFPKLRVIDISINNFTGNLPSEYIIVWNSMSVINLTDSRYMGAYYEPFALTRANITIYGGYRYSTTIVNKGVDRYYEVIRENFAYIDFSCNKFNGEIPQLIGNLKGLRSLNLSFNILTGNIPSSLGNLTELESLDLSNNQLSGEIPQQLVGLTFLQSFDVSHNDLTGLIPQGNQFDTFDNGSFEGNLGLCGIPLSNKCEDSKAFPLPPTAEEDDNSGYPIELDWKFVLAGSVSGFVVGVAIGDMVMTKRQGWFLRAFKRIPLRS